MWLIGKTGTWGNGATPNSREFPCCLFIRAPRLGINLDDPIDGKSAAEIARSPRAAGGSPEVVAGGPVLSR